MKEDEIQNCQDIDNVNGCGIVGNNIHGNNISINQLPCEIILLLLKIIIKLLDKDDPSA